jgi:hypothetical protein
MKKKIVYGAVALVVVAVAVLGITLYKNKGNMSPEMAKLKIENFVTTLVPAGTKATVSNVTKSYGLYKATINIGAGQTVDSYVTKDGKLFFPQALEMNGAAAATTDTTGAASATTAAVNVPKTDKPVIELFVMSYCPYGTQIEKGILPAIKALGSKIDYTLKFVDYSMHGDKELKENLVQYCIQKEQTPKFDAYLTCFLKASDSASCLTSAGIDTAKNDACVAATDAQYKVTDNAKNNVGFKGTYPGFAVDGADNTKYNVGGSPTLIINGTEVSSARDSVSLLKTICSAFNNAPAECSTTLSSTAPAAGFGEGAAAPSGGTAAAGCAQ